MSRTIRVGNPEYSVKLTIADAERVLDLTGVNLIEIREGAVSVFDLYDDYGLAAKVLAALWKPQMEASGVSAEALKNELTGEISDRAIDLLVEALIDFFPSAKRSIVIAMRSKVEALRKAAAEKAEQIFNSDLLDKVAETRMGKLQEQIVALIEQATSGG